MAPSAPRDRRDFKVALICALPLEAGWVEAVFDKFWEDEGRDYGKVDGDQNSYTTGVIGEYNVVLAHLPGMGKVNAATVASSLRISFPNIKLAFIVGICGGVPKDSNGCEIVLGDVIISQVLVQYDFGRQHPTAFEGKDTLEDALGRPSPEIRSMLAKSQTPRSLQKLQEETTAYLRSLEEKHPKSKYPGASTDRLYETGYLHKHHKLIRDDDMTCMCKAEDQACADSRKTLCDELKCDQTQLIHRQRLSNPSGQCNDKVDTEILRFEPMIHFGRIGSGDTVMKSGELRDRLAKSHNIIAFEMEGAGVWEHFPSIVIKGVCDYADSHKNKDWQDYAAATAACSMKALLQRTNLGDRLDGSARIPLSTWHVPFDKLPKIIGREEEIGLIQKRLFHPDESQKAAICGLGGVGKTRIAWEVAKRIQDSSEPCSIFWIQSSSIPTFEKDLYEVGKKLQIPGFENDNADRRQLFKQYLEHQLQGKWLIILDNADDEAIWCPSPNKTTTDTCLLKHMPQSTAGSILITTRSRRVAASFAGRNTIHLQQLEPNEAVETLRGLLIEPDRKGNFQATMNLVNELTCLPLAIVQAAAYMNVKHVFTDEYLKLLLSKKEDATIELLSENFEDESRYQGTQNAIASTWLITFEQIQRNHHKAMQCLSFMCCLDEKNIPQSLLPELSSEKEHIETMGVLLGYSLISKQDQSAPQNSLYSMHRLVRLATRNWLENAGTLRSWTEQAIERVEELSPVPQHENKEIWKLLLPHASVLCTSSHDLSLDCRYNLILKIGIHSRNEGKYTEAVECLSQVVTWREKYLGDTNKSTLDAFNDLGSALRYQGNLVMAEKYNIKALEGSRINLGVEDPDTLKCMSFLATTYSDQGRYIEAERLEVEVLETQKRVLRAEHPDTLISINNLALTYSDQGRYIDAERLQVEVLETEKRVLGAKHPDTLSSMNNLATTYRSQGRYIEAEHLQVEVLEIRKRVQGAEHPDTLISINNLALTYWDQGRYIEAERLQVEVLKTRKRVLGAKHPDTLASMNNLASTYRRQGRYIEAKRLQVGVLETRKRVLGLEHPSTLSSMNNLATTYWDQGRYIEAEHLQVEVLETQKRVLGLKHPDTLLSMNNLAFMLRDLARDGEAVDLMIKCVELREATLGANHPDTEKSRETLNNWRKAKHSKSSPTKILQTMKLKSS